MDDTTDMTGKGRGRGWLKLDKQQEPGGLPQPNPTVVSEQALTTNYPMYPQYDKIIHSVSQFNASDDGILINQKLKYTLELVNNECRTADDVRQCFMYIYKKAKNDTQFLNNFVVFIALNSFRSLTIHDVNLRYCLLGAMQNDFENAETICLYNRNEFKNLIRILGGFFDRARLSISNKPYHMLVIPIISCLEMLLDTTEEDDVKLFVMQMCSNGVRLLDYLNQSGRKSKIIDLTNKVRNLLISGMILTESSRTWLLLSLDMCNIDFRMLPPELLNFYQNKLGEKIVDDLQKTLSTLSIQTQQSSQPQENCVSDVNVLQVDTPPPPNPQINHTNKQKSSYRNSRSENFNLHQSKDENTSETNLTRKSAGKAGRPILGAGARSNKDSSKENASEWDVKQKNMDGGTGWRNARGETRNNKGWEHDDRFDNDY